MKKLAILGSTGSIGEQTLQVVDAHRDRFEVVALAAGTKIDRLIAQARQYQPKIVSVANADLAHQVKQYVSDRVCVVYGAEGAIAVATTEGADIVVSAMAGAQGCPPTRAAIQAGKTVALANKESLVMAGHLLMSEAKQRGVSILPVDSEHASLAQLLCGERLTQVASMILTASGGALRHMKDRSALGQVTVAEVMRHPNWTMGPKVTLDSATMANKGLEIMEAHWLFGVDYDRIDVLLHPESIVHALVAFIDGSVEAHLSMPDMRLPIQYALSYPERIPGMIGTLDLAQIGSLHFEKVDVRRFPMVTYAREAGKIGGTMPVVFNAANELAGQLFLNERIAFLDIEPLVEYAMTQHETIAQPSWETILDVDDWARRTVTQRVAGHGVQSHVVFPWSKSEMNQKYSGESPTPMP